MWLRCVDPYRLINAYGEQGNDYPQPHQFKFEGNIILPFDISLGVFARYQSGTSFTPIFSAVLPHGLIWGLKADSPGSIKGGMTTDLDLRVEKKFNILGGQLTFLADLFNALNNYDPDEGISYVYGPLYGKRTTIKAPRTYRIGIRLIF